VVLDHTLPTVACEGGFLPPVALSTAADFWLRRPVLAGLQIKNIHLKRISVLGV